MNFFAIMDTSGSAMQAERMRAEVVAANMANAETTRTSAGGPYRRQMVVFAANQGDATLADTFNDQGNANLQSASAATAFSTAGPASVAPGVRIDQVVEDTAPPLKRYDPGHPDAGPDGYVEYPDINPLTEMVDLMGATRAYSLNGSAVQAEKNMIASALEIAKS
ncbi:MAG TPA: flagellar basal body rod protein FlgC [Terracidiphilus sp.]|jgi:flagellar basal-body rod protein FlgC|nr:flagellar basal body rod protein FlgC [Terracidiphilus sp.]